MTDHTQAIQDARAKALAKAQKEIAKAESEYAVAISLPPVAGCDAPLIVQQTGFYSIIYNRMQSADSIVQGILAYSPYWLGADHFKGTFTRVVAAGYASDKDGALQDSYAGWVAINAAKDNAQTTQFRIFALIEGRRLDVSFELQSAYYCKVPTPEMLQCRFVHHPAKPRQPAYWQAIRPDCAGSYGAWINYSTGAAPGVAIVAKQMISGDSALDMAQAVADMFGPPLPADHKESCHGAD